MKVKYLGHAAFLITADDGTKIVADPYQSGGGILYGPIAEQADIAVVSHEHADHNNVAGLRGQPAVVRDAGSRTLKGVSFRSIPAHHDASGGSQRGKNLISVFDVDGVTLAHLGDLGHQLSADQVAAIGQVDVLFVPVGGVFTVDAAGASDVVTALNPRVVIPMHFKTDRCGFPLAKVDDFLAGKSGVKRIAASEVEIAKSSLPSTQEIVVLQPAL